ncbi:MAG: hypothetical protein JOS17DRAFT_759112, partial [Linnemannia elongata]
MNSSCSFCISIPSSFLYSSLLFIFLLPFSFLPLLFQELPLPFPTSSFPFSFFVILRSSFIPFFNFITHSQPHPLRSFQTHSVVVHPSNVDSL